MALVRHLILVLSKSKMGFTAYYVGEERDKLPPLWGRGGFARSRGKLAAGASPQGPDPTGGVYSAPRLPDPL